MTKVPNTLMQIDHPDWLFGALCSMKKTLTFGEFEDLLVGIARKAADADKKLKGIKKGSRSIEMNLYMLTTLRLVESHGQKGALVYTRTSLGDKLCEIRSSSHSGSKYQQYLRSLLMRNPLVGPTFQEFMKVVQERDDEGNPLSTRELRELFRGETDRTLLSLGKEARLIKNPVRDFIRPLEAKEGSLDNTKEFNRLLRKSYSALIKPRIEGVQLRNTFVEISKLRDVMLSIFGVTDDKANEKFDRMLTRLLDSQLGRNIHVHGAAPQFLPEKDDPEFENRVFRYEGKIYVFISID